MPTRDAAIPRRCCCKTRFKWLSVEAAVPAKSWSLSSMKRYVVMSESSPLRLGNDSVRARHWREPCTEQPALRHGPQMMARAARLSASAAWRGSQRTRSFETVRGCCDADEGRERISAGASSPQATRSDNGSLTVSPARRRWDSRTEQRHFSLRLRVRGCLGVLRTGHNTPGTDFERPVPDRVDTEHLGLAPVEAKRGSRRCEGKQCKLEETVRGCAAMPTRDAAIPRRCCCAVCHR
jgi:hypothetical protein